MEGTDSDQTPKPDASEEHNGFHTAWGALRILLAAVAVFFSASTAAYADDFVYLNCKADREYVGTPNILIDKGKRTITIAPIKEGLPLLEDETTYEGRSMFEQQIMFRVTVNKFTLRYTTSAPSGLGPRFTAGQCVVEQKKL